MCVYVCTFSMDKASIKAWIIKYWPASNVRRCLVLERNKIPDTIDMNRRKTETRMGEQTKETRANETKKNPRSDLSRSIDYFQASRNVIINLCIT